MRDHSTHRTGQLDSPPRQDGDHIPWKRLARWLLWAFIVMSAALLIAQHREHLGAALPFLILLACPLLHVFMHRGHGQHGRQGSERDGERDPESAPARMPRD